jgi:hypothetical protein
MRTTRTRRTATVLGGATLLAGIVAGTVASFAPAASAAPAPLPPSKDRVVRLAPDNLLQPVGNVGAPGTRVTVAPRVGKAQQTAEFQVWTQINNGKGTISLLFQPSANSGRPLCLDVAGDSRNDGAPLELRPCDGTPSQSWRLLGGGTPPHFVQNVNSGLNMEAELRNNRVVQRGFVPRVPAGASIEERQALRERNSSQLFFLSPKSFGVGGA